MSKLNNLGQKYVIPIALDCNSGTKSMVILGFECHSFDVDELCMRPERLSRSSRHQNLKLQSQEGLPENT